MRWMARDARVTLSLAQVAVLCVALLSLGFLYLNYMYNPSTHQAQIQLQTLQSQIAQLRGNFQLVASKDVISTVKASVELIEQRLSGFEAGQQKLKVSVEESAKHFYSMSDSVNDLQNKLMGLQEAVASVEKLYTSMSRANADEHSLVRDAIQSFSKASNELSKTETLSQSFEAHVEQHNNLVDKEQLAEFTQRFDEKLQSLEGVNERNAQSVLAEVKSQLTKIKNDFDQQLENFKARRAAAVDLLAANVVDKGAKEENEPDRYTKEETDAVNNSNEESKADSSHQEEKAAETAPEQVDTAREQADTSTNVVADILPEANHVRDLGMSTALLIICHDRPDYLERTLDKILRFHPMDAVPIVISQDGGHQGVKSMVQKFETKLHDSRSAVPFAHIVHSQQNNELNGYQKLAAHYKFALDTVFYGDDKMTASKIKDITDVIILEEDLDIANDFYVYFDALAQRLRTDTSLLAVSAWNDNGMAENVKDPKQLYRSDFFPGLGWMLTKRVWDELSPKWPRGYWDDWLREPPQRMGRHTIRPEVCRTFHFGTKGTSNAEYSSFLSNIKLNDVFTDFNSMDLSYLDKDSWTSTYISQVNQAPEISADSFFQGGPSEVRVKYHELDQGQTSFMALARRFGIMDNIKAGVPRTAFEGVVSFWKNDRKVHLVHAR